CRNAPGSRPGAFGISVLVSGAGELGNHRRHSGNRDLVTVAHLATKAATGDPLLPNGDYRRQVAHLLVAGNDSVARDRCRADTGDCTECAVGMTAEMEPGHCFLAHVAALVIAHAREF